MQQVNNRGFCAIKELLKENYPCGGVIPCWACSPCVARHDKLRVLETGANAATVDSSNITMSSPLKDFGMVLYTYNQNARARSKRKSPDNGEVLESVPSFAIDRVISAFNAAWFDDNLDFILYCLGGSVEMRGAW